MSKHLKEKSKMDHIDIHSSLLDVLKKNLEIANRVTYIHRVIYIGEHSFTNSTIHEVFEENIRSMHGRYCYEPLSGLLLYYSRYYVHMVEGPEEVIMRHLKRIFWNVKYESYFKRGKILVAYHNINQRFFKKWGSRFAEPPTLLTTLDSNAKTEEYLRLIKNCIEKIYNLCKVLQVPPQKINDDHFDEEAYEEIGVITDSAKEFLPEFALLDFLLNYKPLLDIYSYIGQYRFLTQLISFRSNVWPVNFENVPFDVFDIPEEPIQDLIKQEDNINN